MAKDPTPAKLAELKALQTAATVSAETLRPYLRDRSNSVVAKAAALVPQGAITALLPDLLTAFERLLRDPLKADAQCTGKIAILKALRDMEADEPALFFRAAAHHQWEPVWGGTVDTAIDLRANAAHALAACHAAPVHDVYLTLTDLMADAAPRVRAEAALAAGRFDHPQSELLLRLKLRLGDEAVEVMGACFDALLAVAPERAVPLVAAHLNDTGADSCFEAASALGASRLPDAFGQLITRIADGHPQSDTFLRCLVPKRSYPELRARILEAVEAGGSPQLRRVFDREFPPPEC